MEVLKFSKVHFFCFFKGYCDFMHIQLSRPFPTVLQGSRDSRGDWIEHKKTLKILSIHEIILLCAVIVLKRRDGFGAILKVESISRKAIKIAIVFFFVLLTALIINCAGFHNNSTKQLALRSRDAC